MLPHALYDESVSRSIVYLASVLWLDTESLGFNAEVRGLGQFEIRLLRQHRTKADDPESVVYGRNHKIFDVMSFYWLFLNTDNLK